MIPSKTDQQLRQLAVDISEGRVFTNRHCRAEMVLKVFPVLGFMKREEAISLLGNAGLVYEYNSERVKKLSVDGMPMFLCSANFLNKPDTTTVLDYVKELNLTKLKFVGTVEAKGDNK